MTFTPPRPAADASLRSVWVVLVLGLVARVVLAVLLDPGLDEAYAISVSRVWQLSWFDHPPMSFWWVAAMRTLAAPLFGGDVPVVVLRIPFILAFTLTSWLMFDLTRRLWGVRAGLWALIALTLAPFFLVSAGTWLVGDGPLLLFLAAAARFLVEILFFAPDPRRERRLWVMTGLALGLATLTKYHAALFALGLIVFALATPHRRRFAGAGPWLALAIVVVLFTPVLWWNAQNDWVSFLFQMARGSGPRESAGGAAKALLGQFGYLGPWTLVGSVLAAAVALRAERSFAGPAGFLVAVALPPILLFSAIPFFGGDSVPHGQMPGWFFLLPLLGRGIAVDHVPRSGIPRLAALFGTVSVSALVVATGLAALLRFAPPGEATIERLGIAGFITESVSWRGIVAGLDGRGLLARDGLGRPPVVAAFNRIEAARLGGVLGGRATVVVLDDDPRGFAFLTDPRSLIGRDVVLVGRPLTFTRSIDRVAPYFDRIETFPSIPIRLGETTAFEARIAVGRAMRKPYPLPYPAR